MLWQSSKSPTEPTGTIVVFNLVRLVDCYASYFGALTAVAWSPDGRFILVGTGSELECVLIDTPE